MNLIRNVHPVHPADELHEVRQSIRELEVRETELRAALLADPKAMAGHDWQAYAQTQEREVFDLAAAKRHFGTAVLAQFIHRQTIKAVRLVPRGGEPGHELSALTLT